MFPRTDTEKTEKTEKTEIAQYMAMAGDSGKVMFLSSRVVSPVPAKTSVMSGSSENRGTPAMTREPGFPRTQMEKTEKTEIAR